LVLTAQCGHVARGAARAQVVASVVIGKKNEAETGDADADGPNDPLAFKEALNPRTQVFMRKEDDVRRPCARGGSVDMRGAAAVSGVA